MTNVKCKSCGALMFWARTEKDDKNIPVDAQQSLTGNITLLPGGIARVGKPGSGPFTSHFATCPNAGAHRKPKAPTHEVKP